VNHDEARRLSDELRNKLWSTASDDLLARLTDRGGMKAGLNPPDELEDEELAQIVWQALKTIGMADE